MPIACRINSHSKNRWYLTVTGGRVYGLCEFSPAAARRGAGYGAARLRTQLCGVKGEANRATGYKINEKSYSFAAPVHHTARCTGTRGTCLIRAERAQAGGLWAVRASYHHATVILQTQLFIQLHIRFLLVTRRDGSRNDTDHARRRQYSQPRSARVNRVKH